MTDTREKGKVDFQDVAKLATQLQPSAGSEDEQKENSGIIHLSALAAGELPATAEAEPGQETPAPSVPLPPADPTGGPAPLDHRSPPRPAPIPPRVGGARWIVWIALAGGIALGALLAGGLLTIRAQKAPLADRTAATVSPPPSASLFPNTPSGNGRPATTPASPATDHPVDLSALPFAPASGSSRLSASAALHAAGAAPATTFSPAAASHAPVASAAMAGAVSPGPSPSVAHLGTDDGLETLMKRAVGEHATVLGAQPVGEGPPETTSAAEALPLKPSMGAVQGALGTVMPAARYCLGPDDPVSRATITFKSDGSVQDVAVAGNAAGHPAEGCIRSRLMAARVPPFASPTFTWTVAVRPAN